MAACTSCGTELPAGARFCSACGEPVAAQPSGEMLKLATILFADVVSSTARAERLHPEDARALMMDFFGAMSEVIRAEGGTIEKFAGDAIMAVFGVPSAHEDDPLRAVRAARRMLDRLEEWNRGRDDPVEVRIGINTGEVLAAAGDDLLVTGDPVNVAARLQQAGEPGQILVGERTARSIRGGFELRPLEALDLKGKTEGVAAWAVDAERKIPEGRGVPGLTAPLIGRDDELELLQSIFARVRGDGSPHLVTILADAGVGKSRLIRELVGRLEVETKVLVGRCLPYGEGVTLWPLAEILKAEALVFENDPPAEALAKIRGLAGDEATTEALASTLGLTAPGGDPREAYRTLVSAWRSFISSLACEQPLALVVEDLHWADETMLDVLDDLAERVEGPVLVLCSARPELLRVRPGWGGGRRNYSSLPLDPLTPDETGELVSSLLEVDELPQRLRSRILERSEGNPFFLEEIVRRLIDEGAVAPENGRWRARGDLSDVEIPDNVQAVILARIDLLEPTEKRVFQHAAVIGRTFWRGGLARLGGDDGLDDVLRTLTRRELVVERLTSSMGGDVEYAFKHVLTRDVAYDSLPRRERARVHAAIADWLEEASGERADELAEFLAHHWDVAWTLAEDDDARLKARTAYLTAADRATRRFALGQAERFGKRALELSTPGLDRAMVLEALGDTHALASHGEASWAAYIAAIDERGRADPEFPRLAATAAIGPTRWHGTMHTHPPAADVLELIEAGLAAAGEVSAERALLLASKTMLGVVGRIALTPEAESAAHEAVAIAERIDDPEVLSCAYDAFSARLLPLGRYAEIHENNRRRIELVPRLTNPAEIGDAHAMVARSGIYPGLYREAEESASAGVAATHEVSPGGYLHCLTWRVWARFMLGEWDGALEDQAELERAMVDDPRGLPPGPYMRAYAIASFCSELRDDRSEADRRLREVERFLATGPRIGLVGGVGYVARTLAHQGQPDEARRLFPGGFPETGGEATNALLEAFTDVVAAEEDHAAAAELVERARQRIEIGGLKGLPLFVHRLRGRLAAADGDRDEAARLLRRSADGFAELEAPWEDAWSRLLLAEVTGERVQAERALQTFERLRSVQELERAHSFLGAPTREA